jgi:hypothetical protein
VALGRSSLGEAPVNALEPQTRRAVNLHMLPRSALKTHALQHGTQTADRRVTQKPKAHHYGGASDYLPLMGGTGRSYKKLARCSCSLTAKASLSIDLLDLDCIEARLISKTRSVGSRRLKLELRSPGHKRKPMRSANLVKGLPSPLLCAPARWPARILGCSASPRLAAYLAACVGAPLDSLRAAPLVYPICLHLRCRCAYSGHLPLGAPTSSRTGGVHQTWCG